MVKIFNRPNFLEIFRLGILKSIVIVAIPILLFSLVGILDAGTPYTNVPKIVGAILVYALFEEYGWRRYLQSELSDIKKVYKYLIITILWFVWHLNFELSINNLIFFLLLFAGSYGIGYIADRSKSLIMCGLFHSFSNVLQSDVLSGIDFNYRVIIVVISALSAILIMRTEGRNLSRVN